MIISETYKVLTSVSIFDMFFQNPVAWQKAHLILDNGLVFLKIPSKLNCCQRGFQETPHFILRRGPATKWDEMEKFLSAFDLSWFQVGFYGLLWFQVCFSFFMLGTP